MDDLPGYHFSRQRLQGALNIEIDRFAELLRLMPSGEFSGQYT